MGMTREQEQAYARLLMSDQSREINEQMLMDNRELTAKVKELKAEIRKLKADKKATCKWTDNGTFIVSPHSGHVATNKKTTKFCNRCGKPIERCYYGKE